MQLYQHRGRARERSVNECQPSFEQNFQLWVEWSVFWDAECDPISSVFEPVGPHYPHSFRPKVILTDSNCVSSCKYLRNERACILERIFVPFLFACLLLFFFSFFSIYLIRVNAFMIHCAFQYNDTKRRKWQNDDDEENIWSNKKFLWVSYVSVCLWLIETWI